MYRVSCTKIFTRDPSSREDLAQVLGELSFSKDTCDLHGEGKRIAGAAAQIIALLQGRGLRLRALALALALDPEGS